MLKHYHLSRENGKIWIREDAYDPAFEEKTESLFAQANGRIGVRACFGLPSLYGKRETFYAGLFHRAAPEEVTELVNCPDLTAFRLRTGFGELSPDGPFLKACRRSFCPDTGELEICMEFGLPDGRELLLREHRFASFDDAGLFAQKITLEAKKGNFRDLQLVFLTDGQADNEGVSHFSPVTCRVFDRRVICLEGKLAEKTLRIMCFNCVEKGEFEPPVFTLRRRGIEEGIGFTVEEGRTLCAARFGSFQVFSGEGEDISGAQKKIQTVAEKGFLNLLEDHRKAMEALCRRCRLEIDGATKEEEAVLALSRYHLLAMMPWGREDCSAASKGLTGEGYRGHVFWDTELFIQPFFTWFFPEQSRHMLSYRLGGLAGAREKAKEYGYRGAMYPWEAALDGQEETPLFAALNIYTGEANPVWSGRKEHHVSADIAYALWQYLSFSGDREFLREGGYEMLFAIADFWVSRAEEDDSGRMVIRDIIGPDEYTEHIDNNAYTNYMAAFAVKQALDRLSEAEKEKEMGGAEAGERRILWEEFLRKIYLPGPDEDGIIPQDDTFLRKEQVPEIEKYREAPVRQTILREYSREEVNELQVLKQADTVMLLNLFPDLFPPGTVRKNVLFYEARTIHDSSLSYCAHAQALASVGEQEQAWKYFRKSLAIDWNDNPMESTDGIHAAAMGGIWNCVVQGFAGIRCEDGRLVIKPHLPAHWKSVELPLMVQNRRLRVRITREKTEITPE